MSTRSERAQRRATKLRNQRIALIVILLLILAGGAYLAYSSFAGPKPAAAPAAGEMPDLSDMQASGAGLDYKDVVVGTGAEATTGKQATVHYTGWLRSNGQKFDSSKDHGQPFTFTLGAGNVIQGWDKGVAGMKVGGTRILVIPPELGYGATGAGSAIPPNAVLVFQVELLDVK
jgi:FKBP-type peptidyl-prolyl cis-trans isomerase FkpA